MLFMIHFQIHPGALHDTLAAFADLGSEGDAALMGEGVRLVGRWHNLVEGNGVAIYEADSAEDLAVYAMHWNGTMELEITPVVDDAGARAVAARRTAAE